MQVQLLGLIWSEPALAWLQDGGQQEARHRPSARPPGLLARPLGRTAEDLETRDPRGQAEAVRASLRAQPLLGQGFPGFCLYMAEERRQRSDGPEVLSPEGVWHRALILGFL